MNVIDTRLPQLLRGSRALLGMFVGIPSPSLVEMCGHAGVDFVIEPYLRFEGLAGEQWTMFLLDPAGNALEFKAFSDDAQVFAR